MARFFFTFFLLFSVCLQANDKKISEVSEAFGHLLGKNLETIGVDFDIDAVVKGLKDCLCGEASPMSEGECVDAIAMAQEQALEKRAGANLIAAEQFLKDNTREGVVSLEGNKLQYEITREGEGPSVAEGSTPTILYTGTLLDGSVFGASKQAEPFHLSETIQGFQKGIVGMKKGEKRTLYIHPDLAYGKSHVLPPNSLLTFEIEVIDVESP